MKDQEYKPKKCTGCQEIMRTQQEEAEEGLCKECYAEMSCFNDGMAD